MKTSMKFLTTSLSLLLAFQPAILMAQSQKLKDFRGTMQKIALIGVNSEFMEQATEDKYTNQIRKLMNRYSRSYGESSIKAFNLPQGNNKTYLKPTTALDDNQKKFLQAAGKNNQVDIIVLGALRESGDQVEAELQLYDVRIETMSGIEKASFTSASAAGVLEGLVFKIMNYLDRDGFVHPSAQDFLESPISVQQAQDSVQLQAAGKEEFSVNPNELSGGFLAGDQTIGGEKTPFWETWWFWTIIGGTAITAASLGYYFLVVDQPTSKANIGFSTPP